MRMTAFGTGRPSSDTSRPIAVAVGFSVTVHGPASPFFGTTTLPMPRSGCRNLTARGRSGLTVVISTSGPGGFWDRRPHVDWAPPCAPATGLPSASTSFAVTVRPGSRVIVYSFGDFASTFTIAAAWYDPRLKTGDVGIVSSLRVPGSSADASPD